MDLQGRLSGVSGKHGVRSGEARRDGDGEADRENAEAHLSVLLVARHPARLRESAIAKGVIERDAADALDDAQALRLIFAPGFSTAETVTSVSGRGVGMDAVRIAVEQLDGHCQ